MIIIDQVSCFQKNSHHETYRMSNLSLLAVILIRHYYREATLANKSNHPATMFNAEKYDKRDGSNIRDPSPTADLAVLALCRIEAVFGRPDGSARSRTFSISLRPGPGRLRTVTDFFDQPTIRPRTVPDGYGLFRSADRKSPKRPGSPHLSEMARSDTVAKFWTCRTGSHGAV